MIIQIAGALKHPGRSFEFSVEGDVKEINVYGDIIRINNPIQINGLIMYTGEDFIVKGNFIASYTTLCGVCSDEVKSEVSCEFNDEFAMSNDLSHPDRFTYAGNTIDLSKMVYDNICLNLPMKHVCKDECKGLCPSCGQNLNISVCGCDKRVEESTMNEKKLKNKDNPFAVLGNLFNDEDEEV